MDGSTLPVEPSSIVGVFQTAVDYSLSPSSSIGIDSPMQAEVIIGALEPPVNSWTSTVEPDCSQFTFVIYVIVFGSMCAFGLVGNFLSFAVLGWERRDRGRVATFLLQTMAVVDNLFLLAAGVSQISMALKLYTLQDLPAAPVMIGVVNASLANLNGPLYSSMSDNSMFDSDNGSAASTRCCGNACPFDRVQHAMTSPFKDIVGYRVIVDDDCYDVTTAGNTPEMANDSSTTDGGSGGNAFAYFIVNVSAYAAVVVFPLVHVTQMWTVWITVLVAVNRYVAICRPFQVSQVCTMKQTTRQIAALGVAIFVYCLPRFFEYQIEYERAPVRRK